jgi:O-antigen/teichoic acid export membrane protein
MKKIKSLFARSDYLRNILTLMTGTVFSQAIPILVSPWLTRIYEPKDFGVLALYVSIVMTMAIVATGRYEQAILLPKEDDDALQVLSLTILLASIVSALMLLIVEIAKTFYSPYLESLGISNWISFVPISVLVSAVYQSFYGWLSRKKVYRIITLSRVISSIAMTVTQLTLFMTSNNGLLVGYFIGQLSSLLFLIWQSSSTLDYKNLVNVTSFSSLQKQAKRYVKFPTFLVVGHTMNSLSGNMPVFLLSHLFGANISGFYALTLRVVAAPMSLVGLSTAEVFRQKASQEFAINGKCDKTFLKTFQLLLAVSCIPAIIFFFAAPSLFPLLFGEKWVVAGHYAQVLTPMFFVQFITVPLCQMFIVAEKQELDLAWQISRLFLSASAIFVGYKYYSSDIITLGLFSLVFSGLYAVSGVMAYRFSLGK